MIISAMKRQRRATPHAQAGVQDFITNDRSLDLVGE